MGIGALSCHGSGFGVGGTGVAVGGSGVDVGGTGVAVGGCSVGVGGTGVAVGVGAAWQPANIKIAISVPVKNCRLIPKPSIARTMVLILVLLPLLDRSVPSAVSVAGRFPIAETHTDRRCW